MDVFRLVPVDSDAQLREVWPDVRAGLDRVTSRMQQTWIAEDVYHALKTKQSILLVGIEEGKFAGFVVLTMNKGFDGLEGHIWVAYNISKSEYINTSWPIIQGFCKAAGCKRVTMSSSRKGWGRRGERLGLIPVQTLYAAEI
jgi:hypothetical protein